MPTDYYPIVEKEERLKEMAGEWEYALESHKLKQCEGYPICPFCYLPKLLYLSFEEAMKLIKTEEL